MRPSAGGDGGAVVASGTTTTIHRDRRSKGAGARAPGAPKTLKAWMKWAHDHAATLDPME